MKNIWGNIHASDSVLIITQDTYVSKHHILSSQYV